MTTDIIKKLEALTGPDREVDAMLYCFQHGHAYSRKYVNDYAMWVEGVPHEMKIIDRHLDKFTSSVDAAIALAERVLTPYSLFALMNQAFTWMHCRFPAKDHARILPIALCIATLKAKEASPLAGEKRGAE